jgi:amidohydrolase
MAASNSFKVTVHGRQTHGSKPWGGVDPIVVSAQIIVGLQMIVARQTDITLVPSVVTVGAINSGIRSNIIPDSTVFIGTIRTFDADQRDSIFRRIERTATHIAMSAGAGATVEIDSGYPVTINDPALTQQMLPTLQRVAPSVKVAPLVTGAEDFSYFQHQVPGVFVFLGVTPLDQDPATAPANHSPLFFADESALPVGVKTLAGLAVDWLSMNPPASR